MFSYKEKEEQLDSYFSVNKLTAEYDEEFKNRAQTSLGNLLVPGYFKKIAKSLEPILILLEKKPEEVASSHGIEKTLAVHHRVYTSFCNVRNPRDFL